MSWVLLGIIVVAVAFLLASVTRRPEKNVDRAAFGHWIESLIRYYENGASLIIVDKGAQTRLRYVRSESKGDGCRVLVSILRTPLSMRHMDALNGECKAECDFEGEYDIDSDAVMGGALDVRNIWATGAGERCARVAHKAHAVMGVSADARFDLSFRGTRSLERTAHAREKLKDGG